MRIYEYKGFIKVFNQQTYILLQKIIFLEKNIFSFKLMDCEFE